MMLVDKLPESPEEGYWRFDNTFVYSVSLIHKPKSLLVEPPGIVWEPPRDPFTVYVVKHAFIHPETKEFGWVVMPSEDFLVEEVRKEMLLEQEFLDALRLDWSSSYNSIEKLTKSSLQEALDMHFNLPFFGVTK